MEFILLKQSIFSYTREKQYDSNSHAYLCFHHLFLAFFGRYQWKYIIFLTTFKFMLYTLLYQFVVTICFSYLTLQPVFHAFMTMIVLWRFYLWLYNALIIFVSFGMHMNQKKKPSEMNWVYSLEYFTCLQKNNNFTVLLWTNILTIKFVKIV